MPLGVGALCLQFVVREFWGTGSHQVKPDTEKGSPAKFRGNTLHAVKPIISSLVRRESPGIFTGIRSSEYIKSTFKGVLAAVPELGAEVVTLTGSIHISYVICRDTLWVAISV